MIVKDYRDLSVKTPDCHVGAPQWVARFRFDADVSMLFPYINATVQDAQYAERPHHIQFVLGGKRCAIYEEDHNAVVAPFQDRNEAEGFIRRLIAFLNDLNLRKESITPDHSKHQPLLPVLDIYKLLPRTNCKACGFATCMAFAGALGQRQVALDLCPCISDIEEHHVQKLRSMLA